MAFCEFCKAEGQKTGTCAYCGTVHYTAGVTFIFGQSEKESYGSEIRLTDRYLIVRSVSKGEMLGNVTAGAAFGLIGALAATAVDAARKKNYGFYDLQDLQKVIYPYHTNSLKKDTAFKFVNKDGTDFVLLFNLNGLFSGKAAKDFAAMLVKVGVYVENGAGMRFSACCTKPFVNKETFCVRVCPSAARFVQLTEQQFVAAPIGATYNAQQPPAQQVPRQESNVGSADASVCKSDIPVEEKKVNQVMCFTCGSMNKEGACFCVKCGTQLQAETQQAPVSPVDAWTSKW